MSKWKIDGMKDIEKSLKKMGEVPQKHVTRSARKGMNIVLKDARKNAPKDTGELKRGIKLAGESSRGKSKGKKVYQVVFDRKKNDIFQKKNESGKVIGYYPVSQEYGFYTRDGKYIEGKRFISDAFNGNIRKVEKTIVDEMGKRIDKAMEG